MHLTVLLLVGIIASVFLGFNIGGSSTGTERGPSVGAGIVSKSLAAVLVTFFVFWVDEDRLESARNNRGRAIALHFVPPSPTPPMEPPTPGAVPPYDRLGRAFERQRPEATRRPIDGNEKFHTRRWGATTERLTHGRPSRRPPRYESLNSGTKHLPYVHERPRPTGPADTRRTVGNGECGTRRVGMNPRRVDSIIDLTYGLLIALSVGFILTVGTQIGVAFGLGVIVSYVIHIVWKMARFDPQWMTTEVQQTVEETVADTVDETVQEVEQSVAKTVDESVEQTVEETVDKTVEEKVGETVEETVSETVEETVGETVDKTVEEKVGETVGETVEEAVEETVSETVEETVGETVEQTVEETVDKTVEEKVGETVGETVEEAVEETVSETVEETVGETVEEAVERSVGEKLAESSEGDSADGDDAENAEDAESAGSDDENADNEDTDDDADETDS